MSEALVVEAAGSKALPVSESRQTEEHDEPGVTWRADELDTSENAATNTVVIARLIMGWREMRLDARGRDEGDGRARRVKFAMPTRPRSTSHKTQPPQQTIFVTWTGRNQIRSKRLRSRLIGGEEGTERQATGLVTLESSYRCPSYTNLCRQNGLAVARRRN